jgi:predicted nuclease of restriction endonuclease-like RecB superfamily
MPELREARTGRIVGLSELAEAKAVRPIAPQYVTAADHPWLRALIEERERFAGRRRGEWQARLSERLPVSAPRGKVRVALSVLDRLARDLGGRGIDSRKVRAVVYRVAARDGDRNRALARAGVELGLTAEAVEQNLFADLAAERMLAPLPEGLSAIELTLRCNEAIVIALLYRALRVRVWMRGQTRAVVRHAQLTGLLCRVTTGSAEGELVLEVSGPYALFRHTRMYGRALGSLVQRLAWCNAFRLEADCVLEGGEQLGRLVLRSGDPVAPARELPRFDSRVEERFARAFEKLAPEWEAVREPQPFAVDGSMVFPDFELRHRPSGERWLLEIVGYWTAEYVERKLVALRRARIDKLIVCIDDARTCEDEAIHALGHVVRYRRSVDPSDILAIIDPELFAKLPPPAARRSRAKRGAGLR